MTTRSIPLAACTLALVAALPASAAVTYQFRQVIPGLVASPTPQAQEPVAALLVALSSGNLPAATVGQPYSYDLKQLLSVTGESNPDKSAATWSVVAGALPANLTVNELGVVFGTPTTKNEVGASFEVKASYKGKDGQQVYTLVVEGVVLRVTQISAGAYHTCAVTAEGGAKCWGRNDVGQLGDNTLTTRRAPVAVVGLEAGVAAISAGGWHTCAVTTAGELKCWGHDYFGALGDNNLAADKKVPTPVLGMSSGVASVSAGANHTCAVTTAGAAKCWGSNNMGQLGTNNTTTYLVPMGVQGLSTGVARITAGSSHSCALMTTGGVKCWGSDQYGQLGNDPTLGTQWNPVDVSGLTAGAIQVEAGGGHTCAVTSAGGVACWGRNADGQLGDTTLIDRATPVEVFGLATGVTSVAAGRENHTCAVVAGAAKCWGAGTMGQLGENAGTTRLQPVSVLDIAAPVVAVSAGTSHACAVTATGAAKCWGDNYHGPVGDGTATNRPSPVDVTP